MPHNIKTPVRAEVFGDQWIIKDADGKFVCNTLTGNDEANAKFIAGCINYTMENYMDGDPNE